ncbi:hypothetical protein ACTXIU_15150 [Glutamicibacter arilaitensis]|uniref:hypothetical protein n=1 Tax=Glutamicibacter arilaitensis TaxID=256701 RepID=UPI003FD357F8
MSTGSSGSEYSLLRKWWGQTSKKTKLIWCLVPSLVVAALIWRWFTFSEESRYMLPSSAEDWSAWGTWIGSLGAAAALFYAALSFQENARAGDANQQELLNDIHSVAKAKASKMELDFSRNPPRDLQYIDEAMKAHEAELAYHEMMTNSDNSAQSKQHEQTKPSAYSTFYVWITNNSEHETFDDLSLRLTDPSDQFSIQKKSYRSPLPLKGRNESIPGSPPQWQSDSPSPAEKEYNTTKYLGLLRPQTQILLELRFKSLSDQILDMRWEPSVKLAFGISPEGEMLFRFRDEAGRYWHRSNQSLSDELFRTWMPGDEPTPRQRKASEQ